MDLKTRIVIFAYLKNLKAPAQTHFLKHYRFTYMKAEGMISEDGDRHKDKVDTVYVCYTTFMNESGMTESQRNAIFQEHCMQWRQLYDTFLSEAKNGTITLRIEP